MIFKVWTDENDPDSARSIVAIDADTAAILFMEDNFSRLDYPEEQEVFVKGPDGVETKWLVEVEACPVFRASEAKTSEA